MAPSLEGWNIGRAEGIDWSPWGQDGNARAKIIGNADRYFVALVEADAGYRGSPHEHTYAEFFYLGDGKSRNQGEVLTAGDGYAAASGSTHDDFEALAPSTYLTIFKI